MGRRESPIADRPIIETARLRLRQWTDADREPLARLNADPEVMRHFPAPLSRAESDAMYERMRAQIDAHGWGFWAVETHARAFVGIVGLVPVKDAMPLSPGVEIGWRLARAHWGRGCATEAARAALDFAFGRLQLAEVLAYTAQTNTASQAVMERLGMERALAFDHPALPGESPLRPHFAYRVRRVDAPLSFACGTFHAAQASAADLEQLQRFYEANPGYFTLVEGAPPGPDAARESLDWQLPAGWRFTRKLLLLFRGRDDSIIGVADIVADLFSRGVWHIAFFMTADRFHGSGVSHALYAHLEAWMRGEGARWLRLGVVRGNGRGERFWKKMGYVDVAERRDYPQGAKRHTLRVMAKALAGGALDEYRELVPRDRDAAVAVENP